MPTTYDSTSSGKHLAGTGLVLVDTLEGGHQFAEESGHDGGHMNEGSLFAERQTGAQGAGEAHDLGDQRPEGQILVQNHPSQDGFHLGDAGANCSGRAEMHEASAERHQDDWRQTPGEILGQQVVFIEIAEEPESIFEKHLYDCVHGKAN